MKKSEKQKELITKLTKYVKKSQSGRKYYRLPKCYKSVTYYISADGELYSTEVLITGGETMTNAYRENMIACTPTEGQLLSELEFYPYWGWV